MAMDVGGAKGGLKADINVTPLVDVMLVLLIIMMLIAPMLQQGVAVTLPEAGNTEPKARHAGSDRRRDRFGQSVLGQRPPVLEDEFADARQGRAGGQEGKSRPDQGRQGREIQRDHGGDGCLRGVGIEDIGLITEPKKDPNAPAGGK